MRPSSRNRLPLARTWVLLALLALGVAPSRTEAQSDAVVVYLVRHSERAEDGTNDPPISEAGQARSDLGATLLQDAGITQIHTTDYKRTRSTGARFIHNVVPEAHWRRCRWGCA